MDTAQRLDPVDAREIEERTDRLIAPGCGNLFVAGTFSESVAERMSDLPLPTAVHARSDPKRLPHPPARTFNLGDRLFDAVTFAFSALIVAVLAGVLVILVMQAAPSIGAFGFTFVTSDVWNPALNVFGARASIVGTLYTSLLALAIATPIGVLVAIFLVEIAPRPLRFWLGFVVELLAAVPSVVYGLWALVVLVPIVATDIQPFFLARFGGFPLVQGAPIGLNVFTASLILSVMILPTITTISRDVMQAVPNSQRDAMLALGATRWEMIWKAVIPYARSGMIGAIVLALGRAVGETMAVQMVIGNTLQISPSLFNQGTTITATIVNQFPETTPGIFRAAIMEMALILMLIAVTLNVGARLLVRRMSTRTHGA